MSVKKNIGWNMLLTLSGYIFPLLTFPYVTRVLGPEGFGMANFALSIVDYAVLLSTLGMAMVGIRSMAQCAPEKEARSEVFSRLVSIHLLLSAVALITYFVVVWCVPELAEHKELYYIGSAKILFNVLLVEWLFQGLQDFRYVTLRTLAVRTLYVVAVFIFVRHREDYDMFFYVTIGQVVLNALINWRYARRYVIFRFQLRGSGEYVSPIFSMGLNAILLSFYTTFNVLYLGFACDEAAVGYYTAAVRLYSIFIAVIGAYNGVFVPYLNTLYAQGEMEKFRSVIGKSINLVSFLALPVIVGGVILAPQIIRLVAGAGYERAVLPFQIVLVQVFLVGIAQILENQILLAFKKYREILICTASTTMLAALIIILFVPTHAEVAAAWAVAIPHVLEMILLYFYARREVPIDIDKKSIWSYVVSCVPIVIVCFALLFTGWNYLGILAVGVPLGGIAYFILQNQIYHNPLIQDVFKKSGKNTAL